MLASAALACALLLGAPLADMDEAARAALARLGAQAALEAPRDGAPRPGAEAPLPPRRVEQPPEDEPSRRRAGPGAAAGPWVAWLLVALGVALALFLGTVLVQWLRRRGLRAREATPPAAVEPVRLPAAALEPADRLAASGQWERAVHRLLLDALALLAARARLALPPDLTSRELLQRLPLDAEARSVLAWLVEAVEVSHFGGQALDAGTWRAARERYARLAGPGSAA